MAIPGISSMMQLHHYVAPDTMVSEIFSLSTESWKRFPLFGSTMLWREGWMGRAGRSGCYGFLQKIGGALAESEPGIGMTLIEWGTRAQTGGR